MARSPLCVFLPTVCLFVAPIVLSPLFIWGTAGRCAFVILLMSCYWVMEVADLAVVALLPMLLFPVLCILPIHSVAAVYLSDTNVMFLGSMMLSLAVEESGLHRRVALNLLALGGTSPPRLIGGFMVITSFVSLWISDSATAALMAPIAIALLESVMIPRMAKERLEDGKETGRPTGRKSAITELDVSRLSARDRGICKCIMLMVSHASLIGGTGTINSTGPNLIFRATIQQFFPNENTGISYLSWMLFAIPPMLLYMFASWTITQMQFLGIREWVSMLRGKGEKDEEEEVEKRIEHEISLLGPISWAEQSVLFWFVVLVSAWITSDPKVIPGWTDLFPRGMVSDSCAGILVTFILFVFPNRRPDIANGVRRDGLLTWPSVQRKFSWSVILLLGAGMAVSAAVKESGLSSFLVCSLHSLLLSCPRVLTQLLLSIIVVTATEFSTNTATASVFIPIAFSMAQTMNVHPLTFAIPAAIGPSFSFMLPMATPANAIVYETGVLSMWEMASCGVLLNIACIGITVLNMNTWTWWLFDMGTVPEYSLRHNNTIPCLG